MASGLHSMLTNPSVPWFGLKMENSEHMESDSVKAWLEETVEVLHTALHDSNFHQAIHEVYIDLGLCGTACLYCEEDAKSGIRFSSRYLGEVFIAEDEKGRVDTVYRLYRQTARQAVQTWGDEKLSKKIKELYEKDPDAEVEFLHVVQPKADLPGTLTSEETMEFANLYIDPEEKSIVFEGGYFEMPYAVPRWTKMSGEKYGRSPAMTVLADIKTLNAMVETTLRAAQKSVDPPVQMPSEGFSLPARLGQRGVNYFDPAAQGRIEPIIHGGDIRLGLQMKNQKRESIRSAFYVDQLQLVGGPSMTATEVLQRTEEKMKLLGPVLGRLQGELLRPIIDRVFGILFRAGRLPELPAELEGGEMRIDYVSPIAKAQKVHQAESIQRAFQFIMPLGSISSEIYDKIDIDKVHDVVVELFGVPRALLRDEKEVQGIRDARARQKDAFAQKEEELQKFAINERSVKMRNETVQAQQKTA